MVLEVIECNMERTVGICDVTAENKIFVGEFNPVTLLTWAQKLAEEYKGHDCVFLYAMRHPKADYPAWLLAATDDENETISVCASGTVSATEVKQHA